MSRINRTVRTQRLGRLWKKQNVFSAHDQEHIIIVVICYFLPVSFAEIFVGAGPGSGVASLISAGSGARLHAQYTPHCITTFLIFAITDRCRVYTLFLPFFNLIHPYLSRFSDYRQLFWFFTDLLPRYV